MMNVLNGGAHADNNVDFQEFMVVPVGAASFSEALRTGAEVFHALKAHRSTTAASQRRWATRAASRRTSTRTRRRSRRSWRASRPRGYTPGEQLAIALDPATSEIFEGGSYVLEHEGRTLSSAEMAGYWAEMCRRYPILSIEDGMDEEDWEGWRRAHRAPRRARTARGRRPLRDQHRAPAARASTPAWPTRSSSR